MRLALSQLNAVVGDVDGNRERIVERIHEARDAGVDLVVFPELATTGYPPEDLLLRPAFVRAAHESVEEIARTTDGLVALVGTPRFDRDLANACAVCADGRVQAVYRKHLPNANEQAAQKAWEALLATPGEGLVKDGRIDRAGVEHATSAHLAICTVPVG